MPWLGMMCIKNLSLAGIGVIIYACIVKHGMAIVWYLIVFAAIMLGGFLVELYNKKRSKVGE